ncbi:SIMPL domain-containing protein [Pseudoalteromonas tunicata]|uniref:SIMPL domain-containing protein n=1 Tax=Pseudoalteromonas tunicata TaxID=314281 RepID=UPI00273F8FFC|nr:SIMPL domain-containing protein [Pseudoalteromonas tunicata]MDP5211964.1 SIMPL domain-containing protein [Pseudoalteromonas tunicata]
MKKILLVLSLISYSALASVIPNEPHIYVEGSSEFGVFPDQIIISVSLSSVNLDAEIAKSEVDQKSLRLFEAVKKLNVEKGDITATPLQINPAFEYEDRKKIDKGTSVNRNVDITLKDLKKYPQLNDILVKAGITSKISSIVEVSNERELKKKALMLALKDARLKAESLAELQNKTIKDVHSISEFKTREDNSYNLRPEQNVYGQSYAVAEQRRRVPPPTPGIFEIGELRVTATVYVVYTIE